MMLYAASCNCLNCRTSGWRVPQLILDLPTLRAKGYGGGIVLYGAPAPTAEGEA